MKKIYSNNRNLGFTLVEMLIVVVIIGILAAALIPRLLGAQSMARDVARKNEMGQIGAGLSMALNQDGIIPLPACADNVVFLNRNPAIGSVTNPNQKVNWRISDFLSDVPQDPQKNHKNYGVIDGNGLGQNPGGYCKGSFVVRDANKGSQQWGGYLVSANMENQKNRNYVISGAYINHDEDIITAHQARKCDQVKLVTTTPTNNCETNQVNSGVYVIIGY